MEILKNQSIVLQFVNFGEERERERETRMIPLYISLSLSLSLSLSPCLLRFCVLNSYNPA